MKKVLFVMADYPDWRQKFFEKWMSPRNKEYAKLHGFEYREIKSLPREPDGNFWRGSPTWLKHKVVSDWINSGDLKEGDIVSHIDADLAVVKTDKSFQPSEGKSFAYAVDSCNTHCMGAYSIRVSEWSKNMLNHMLDEKFFNRMKNNPHWQTFREQAAWYTMSGIVSHSWVPFTDMPNYGFHSHITNEMIYSLEELDTHVDVLPTEWNVTHCVGEGFNDYFMVPTHRKDTIFRHFAGGQRWQEEYFTGEIRKIFLEPAHLGTRQQMTEY